MTVLDKDKDRFLLWLSKEIGLSERSSRDYYSRCKRLDKYLPLEVFEYLSTQNNFIKLVRLLDLYVKSMPVSAEKRYIVKIDLMTSIKRYGAFKNPRMENFYKKKKFI